MYKAHALHVSCFIMHFGVTGGMLLIPIDFCLLNLKTPFIICKSFWDFHSSSRRQQVLKSSAVSPSEASGSLVDFPGGLVTCLRGFLLFSA